MRCPKCQAPLDSSTRRLCVTCIGDAIKHVGENTYSEKIHDAKMASGYYQKRNGAKKVGQTWWK